MKKTLFLISISLVLFLNVASAGTFVSGSTGADGAFNPTIPATVLQLPPNGVFNFTTVNIPAGVTVTFTKNAANTPVYILATGDVTIAGTINAGGGSAAPSTANAPGVGGPGGYDGGWGGVAGIAGGAGGKGLGPGGGGGGLSSGPTTSYYQYGGGGGFGTPGNSFGAPYALGGVTYGNERLIPLIGGSGGGGGSGYSPALGGGGGGGGGAILIASSGTINVTGGIVTRGGDGYNSYGSSSSGCGSGGAIKLIANTIRGGGYLDVYGAGGNGISAGGLGRIRLEAYNNYYSNITYPAYSYGLPGPVFVANTPSLSIASIGGVNVSSSPTASYSTPDIGLPNITTNPVTVTLSASNIPLSATITVSTIPEFGGAIDVTTTLNGTQASSTATASVNLSTDYASVIMAYTTFTLQTAMYYDGEKINKVQVASSMGGKSTAVYLTESGKEIKAEQLMLAGLLR